MIKDYTILASDGEKIRVTTYIDSLVFLGNTIIFVHGFKGFKDWGFGPYLGDFFSKAGFFVITFNFSHNGIGESRTEFEDLDKFAKNTFGREVRELNEVINSVRSGFFTEIGRNCKIGLIGHSRGGAIALLSSYKRDDVDAVSLWASISNFDRYSERQKEDWRKKGYFNILNSRTGQMMRLDVSLLNEIESETDTTLNLKNAVENLKKPLFIAHGDQDMAVKISESEELYDWSDKSLTEFYKLVGTGHTFDIVHPFRGSNEKFERLLKETSNFFNKHLNQRN